jgi:alkylation response protein AidB-like acyl-CoA dehydrogenase
MFVIDGFTADTIVVVARAAGTTGTDGIMFFTVAGDADGLTRTPLQTMDQTRKQAKLEFDNVAASPLGSTQDGFAAFSKTLDQAAVALANEMMGGAQRVLEMSVEYAKVRVQFGRPIGSFQAVQHLCADMLRAVELARAGAYYACWAADAADPAERHRAATIAQAFAADELYTVGASLIQVHGGIGFTWEHDAHLYYKRLLTLKELAGGSPGRLEELASLVLDSG